MRKKKQKKPKLCREMKTFGGVAGGIILKNIKDIRKNIAFMKQKQVPSKNEYSKNNKELLEIKTRIAKILKGTQ